MNKKKLFRWLKLLIVAYSLTGIAFYYLQEKLLFHPVTVKIGEAYHFDQPFKEIDLAMDADTHISLVQFTVPDTLRKGVVLYFHGNRENVTRYAKFSTNFTRNGYEVWMCDYPGFGKSIGKLNEQALYDEALQVYKLARATYKPEQIVIYGKSMGTGIAAQLGAVRDCKRLILETPYKSVTSLARRYFFLYPVDMLLHYHLPTYEYLKRVTAPVAIFHGTNDAVIPYSNAIQLKEVFKQGDTFITIPEGVHNNLNDFPIMQSTLDSLLKA